MIANFLIFSIILLTHHILCTTPPKLPKNNTNLGYSKYPEFEIMVFKSELIAGKQYQDAFGNYFLVTANNYKVNKLTDKPVVYLDNVIKCPCPSNRLISLVYFVNSIYKNSILEFRCRCNSYHFDMKQLVQYATVVMHRLNRGEVVSVNEKLVLAKIIYEFAREEKLLMLFFASFKNEINIPIKFSRSSLCELKNLCINKAFEAHLALRRESQNSRAPNKFPSPETVREDIRKAVDKVYGIYERELVDLTKVDFVKRNDGFRDLMHALERTYKNRKDANRNEARFCCMKILSMQLSNREASAFFTYLAKLLADPAEIAFATREEIKYAMGYFALKNLRFTTMLIIVDFLNVLDYAKDPNIVVYLGLHELCGWYIRTKLAHTSDMAFHISLIDRYLKGHGVAWSNHEAGCYGFESYTNCYKNRNPAGDNFEFDLGRWEKVPPYPGVQEHTRKYTEFAFHAPPPQPTAKKPVPQPKTNKPAERDRTLVYRKIAEGSPPLVTILLSFIYMTLIEPFTFFIPDFILDLLGNDDDDDDDD